MSVLLIVLYFKCLLHMLIEVSYGQLTIAGWSSPLKIQIWGLKGIYNIENHDN